MQVEFYFKGIGEVVAEVEQQHPFSKSDTGLFIEILKIDGKSVVHLSQEFEDLIKSKMCEAI